MKMKWLLLSLLMIITVSLKAENKQLFYYLKVSTTNVEVQCYINGFPVYEIKTTGTVINQVPVNLALIGKNNTLKIVAKPTGDNAFVNGDIVPYKGGEMVGTDDDREGVLSFEFSTENESIKTFEFNNDRYDYSDILINTPKIEDEERLKDYAIELVAMVERRDTENLLEQLRPKIEDYAKAYTVESDIMIQNMRQVLNENIFTMKREKVQREDIELVSHCDGRLWELRQNGHPLIYRETENGSEQMEVYVGEIDGMLRIVR